MTRKRIKGTKYNRITKQQKYLFLKLCISQKLSIQEAAHKASIHYSTAKTILFFHKKQYKNYETFIINNLQDSYLQNSQLRTFYKDIEIDKSTSGSPRSRIEIISNCYTNKTWRKNLRRKLRAQQNSGQQEQSRGCMKIKDESYENKEWYERMEGVSKQQEISMKLQLKQSDYKNQFRFLRYQFKQDEKK